VLDAAVAAAAEAQVLARLDERHVAAVELDAAAVVDDDDLVGLAPERIEATPEPVAAAVRDDDDRDAQ
jgi:hypothetical protein